MAHLPSTKDRYFGIEIEFIAPTHTYANNYYSMIKTMGLSSFCTLGGDGSIRTEGYDHTGYELRVLTKVKDLKTNLTKVDAFLKKIKAYTNESCGLHVHLDMRHFKPLLAFKRLAAKQDQIYNSVPEHRRDNEYCEKLDKGYIEEIIEALSDKHSIDWTSLNKDIKNLLKKKKVKYGEYEIEDLIDSLSYRNEESEDVGAHYDGISVEPYMSNSYKTIEVRTHEGTVDMASIHDWCKYLYEVAYLNNVSDYSKKYIKERIRKNG